MTHIYLSISLIVAEKCSACYKITSGTFSPSTPSPLPNPIAQLYY